MTIQTPGVLEKGGTMHRTAIKAGDVRNHFMTGIARRNFGIANRMRFGFVTGGTADGSSLQERRPMFTGVHIAGFMRIARMTFGTAGNRPFSGRAAHRFFMTVQAF